LAWAVRSGSSWWANKDEVMSFLTARRLSDGLFSVEYSDLQTVCYLVQTNNLNLKLMQSVLQGNLFLTIRRVPEMDSCHSDLVVRADAAAVKL